MKTIGERIREERLKRKLTQAKLGEMTGYSRASIGYVELGRVYPSLMFIIALADVFEMSIDELIGRKIKED